jgi:hypothetical protein
MARVFWNSLWAVVFTILSTRTLAAAPEADTLINLTQATVVTRASVAADAERTAAQVLVEEVQKRTGLTWQRQSQFPATGPAIVLAARQPDPQWTEAYPPRKGQDLAEKKPEGFRIVVTRRHSGEPIVWIMGGDGSGTLYGVGQFLRLLEWEKNTAHFRRDVDMASAPKYPIRGHQLGYRPTANSYDGWSVAQYEQYIRDLALFGCNAIENIPAAESNSRRTSRLMAVPPAEMHRSLSEICARYGMAYWLWRPAAIDLKDAKKRAKLLQENEAIYRGCSHLTGVLVPGGDPGDNAPEILLPFLQETAKQLMAVHPHAHIWFSVQGFNEKQVRWVFDYLRREAPTWLGGLAGGPSSPPLPALRAGLPAQYPLRRYPDITHNKLAQFPIAWWDPAFALTLGREAINPRPVQFAAIHNWFAPYGDGFISYSDGAHDDVNKVIWSARSWNPDAEVREILVEYARAFFAPRVAQQAADGILALERNWQGALRYNAGVDGTLLLWQHLEQQAPELAGNWRWQMCLVRAYYDAYVRARQIYELRLENEANAILAAASARGPEAVMDDAMAVLNRAVKQPMRPELRRRIFELCESLFHSICLQTSVVKYGAAGEERGAFLDFVDTPLNNRWWLEDEFAKIRKMPSREAKLARLELIRNWENPGEGSFYDDVGNLANSPHVRFAAEVNTDPEMVEHPTPTFWWWNDGKSRARLSWQTSVDFPEAVIHEGLDPQASYVVRSTGYGKSPMCINGKRVKPTDDGREIGQFKVFPVPKEAVATRRLVLTWDRLADEEELNWRQKSRIAEIWLLKQPKRQP